MKINTLNDITTLVKAKGIQCGMSQSEFAKSAGVTRQWLSKFESGNPNVELPYLYRVLYALKLVLDISEYDTTEIVNSVDTERKFNLEEHIKSFELK